MIADFIVGVLFRAKFMILKCTEQGAIGVLERTDMDQFAIIASLFLQRGSAKTPEGKQITQHIDICLDASPIPRRCQKNRRTVAPMDVARFSRKATSKLGS